MAFMTRLRSLTALLCLASVVACEKNAVQDITVPITGGAFIRFHNYGVNAPGVNFFANDQKLTAIGSTSCSPPPVTPVPACTTTGVESTTGVAYGASANGANYSMVAPGQYTFSSRIAAATDNGLAVSSVATPLSDGKFYSYYVSGIYNATTKKADSFIIEDVLPTTFDYTKAYVRIVNASANAPTLSVTSQLQGGSEVVTVGTNVAYKAASPFVIVTPGLTDITVTIGGIPATFRGVNLIGGHVLTIAVRGDATSATATGLAISGVYNR
jgi:hypothetical protein